MGISEITRDIVRSVGEGAAKAVVPLQLKIAEGPMNSLMPGDIREGVRSRSGSDYKALVDHPLTPKPGEDEKTDRAIIEHLIRAAR